MGLGRPLDCLYFLFISFLHVRTKSAQTLTLGNLAPTLRAPERGRRIHDDWLDSLLTCLARMVP